MEKEREVPHQVQCPNCLAWNLCLVWSDGGDCVAFTCHKCAHVVEVYSNDGRLVFVSDEGIKLHA